MIIVLTESSPLQGGDGGESVSPTPDPAQQAIGLISDFVPGGEDIFIEDSALYDSLKTVQSDFMDIERDHYDNF